MAGIIGQFLGGLLDDGRHQPNPNYQNNPGAVAAPYSPTTQEQPHASFINSHTQNMKGLINNTGYSKGDGNGSIICPLGVGVGVGVGVGRERQTEAQPRPNDTPKQSEEDQWNTKPTYQNIKGLSNQTGSITGHANGLINLGEYTQSRP